MHTDILNMATEAIAFQKASPLAKELTAEFDKMIAYVDISRGELGNTPNVTNDYATSNKERLENIENKFKNDIKPNVENIILKYMGFYNTITVIPLKESCGSFAINVSLDNTNAVIEVLESYTGRKSYRNIKATNDLKELITMADDVDLTSGKIKRKDYFGKRTPVQGVTLPIYFDIGMAFLRHELYPVKDRLTAEELTACILHELGHVETMFERAADMYYMGSYVRDVTNATFGKIRSKEIGDFAAFDRENKISEIFQLLNRDKENANLIPEVGWKIIQNVVIQADKGAKYADSVHDKRLVYLIKQFWYVLLRFLVLIYLSFLLQLRFVYNVIVQSIVNIRINRSYHQAFKMLDKTSDDMFTRRNYEFSERLSDEFVSRHGYGAHLASALVKIKDYNKVSNASKISYDTPNRHSKVSRMLALMVSVLRDDYLLFIPDEMLLPIYEPLRKRIDRLLQNSYAVYKDPNIPKEMQLAYIKETKQLEMLVNKTKYDGLLKKYWTKLCFWAITPWYTLFKTHTSAVADEIANTLDNVDKAMNNKFFYQATRLRNLK